jgi:pimeloyl-ACP methyl ester carboxylesterase
LAEIVREYYVNPIINDALDKGAYVSYSCFDEIPFTDYALARKALKKYPYQQYSNMYLFEMIEAMCEVWDVPTATSEFKKPYKINTPVLIYSGELDPVTPVELAKPVIQNARVSWQKQWPDIAHGVMFSSDCADLTAQEFLNAPESDPFIHECSDEQSKYQFVVR